MRACILSSFSQHPPSPNNPKTKQRKQARDACPALFLTRLPFFRAYDFYVQLPLASGVKLGGSGDDPVATATAKVGGIV